MPPATTVSADDLFLEMLREDSNLEMDWLSLATQVTAAGQRASCFRRALAIHPESRLAQCGLTQLRRRQFVRGRGHGPERVVARSGGRQPDQMTEEQEQ